MAPITTPLHYNLRHPDEYSNQVRHLTTSSLSSLSDLTLPRTRRGETNRVTSDSDGVIFVSHGCLLIPVFVVAWFYYTRRACRKLVRGVLKNHPEQDDSSGGVDFARIEDAYNCGKNRRDESASQPSTRPETTDRLVKWINRRNVQKQFERHGISRTTNQCLYGNPARDDDGGTSPDATAKPSDDVMVQSPLSPTDSLIAVQSVYSDQGLDEDNTGYGAGHSRFRRKSFKQLGRWESIPNASQIELCMVLSSMDENNPTQQTSYNVLLVASTVDRGIETSIHSITSGTDEDPLAVQSSSSLGSVT